MKKQSKKPAEKYDPLSNEDQTILHSFEVDREFGEKTQQYLTSIEKIKDARELIKSIEEFPESNEELRDRLLGYLDEMEEEISKKAEEEDDWEI